MARAPSDQWGRQWTDTYRLRNRLLGAVVEQLVIHPDGARQWLKPHEPVVGTLVLSTCHNPAGGGAS